MPFFPEGLFHISSIAEAQALPWLDVVSFFQNVDSAAVTVDADYTVPGDHHLLLQSAQLRAFPGAGQNITASILIVFRDATQLAPYLVADDAAGAANIARNLQWSGSIVVRPNHTVRARTTFNAGVAANTCRLSVFGMLIPLGNIPRA